MKSVPRRDMLRAVRHLRAADPVMDDVISRVGPIEMLLRRGRFLTLVRSIIGQQISTSAARSINERINFACIGVGGKGTSETVRTALTWASIPSSRAGFCVTSLKAIAGSTPCRIASITWRASPSSPLRS